MALADINIADVGGANVVPALTWNTEANTTVINAGELAIIGTARKYAAAAADGDPVVGTEVVVGVTQSTSTQTTLVDGSVNVYIPNPGTIYSAKAKDPLLANTQAEINALIGKRVVLDLTAGKYTVDTAAADAATNGIVIVGGDFNQSSINFTIQNAGTILA